MIYEVFGKRVKAEFWRGCGSSGWAGDTVWAQGLLKSHVMGGKLFVLLKCFLLKCPFQAIGSVDLETCHHQFTYRWFYP